MSKYTVFDKDTKEVLRVISCSSEYIDSQINTNTEYYEIGDHQKPEKIDPAILARKTRDNLLASTDWTQLPDAPVDTVAWATYRQELRDVPSQEGFPDNIIWPERPA